MYGNPVFESFVLLDSKREASLKTVSARCFNFYFQTLFLERLSLLKPAHITWHLENNICLTCLPTAIKAALQSYRPVQLKPASVTWKLLSAGYQLTKKTNTNKKQITEPNPNSSCLCKVKEIAHLKYPEQSA